MMLLYCPSFRGKAAEFPLTSEKRSPLTIAVLCRLSLHARTVAVRGAADEEIRE